MTSLLVGSWLGRYGALASLLLPVFACAAVGAAWGLRRRAYPGEFIAVLSTSVTTPALVFHTLLTTRLDNAQLAQIAGAVLFSLALAAGFGTIALRLLGLPALALAPTVTFPNAGNLGLPVAQLAFGDTGLAVAVAFFAIASITQHTLGPVLLSRVRTTSPRNWPRGMVLTCATALALRAAGLQPPPPVLESAWLIGSLSVPLMLLSLGYALVTVDRAGLGRGSVVGAIRLIAGAAAGFAVTRLLDLPPLVASVMALQSMLPVAVVSYLYADRYTDQGPVAAGAVLASTLLFVLLSPVMLWSVGAVR